MASRSMLIATGLLLLVALCPAFTLPASADDIGLTSARLTELPDGGYTLEADVTQAQIPAIGRPLVPPRFAVAERPSYRKTGVGFVVRYEFGGSDEPLGPGDAILLPWARSAVLLTARWADGTVQRTMFPREAGGIRVPIDVFKPIIRAPLETARYRFQARFAGGGRVLLYALLGLGMVLASTKGRAFGLVLAFGFGQGLSMLAVELGVQTIPEALATAWVAAGIALLARSALDRDSRWMSPLALAIGLVDGLGVAGGLVDGRLGTDELLPALFGSAAAGWVVVLASVAAMSAAAPLLRRRAPGRGAAILTGSLAVAVAVGAINSGLSAADEARVDPSVQLAAARLDFASGSGTGGARSGARSSAAPRRLESAAMIFLNIEPTEVRVEVLLALRDFLEPLRIEGGPESTVPIEVQPDIALRAQRMAADALSLRIDGREAVPILRRTDFVTVAPTGVTTRKEPQAEPLETSVLGVTFAYGVERVPAEIGLDWSIYPGDDVVIPASWTDPTGSERVELTSAQPSLLWTNDLSGYEAPPIQAVRVQPRRWPLASLVLVAFSLLSWFVMRRRGDAVARWKPVWTAALALAIVLYPFARTAVAIPGAGTLSTAPENLDAVVDDLLTNIYRSFDLRDEDAIYDRLSVTVTGEQLSAVYLENRRALELENRGGARARVDEVDVIDVVSIQGDGPEGLRLEVVWTVSGSVNHFGHVHYRQNRYEAALRIVAIDGVWKIRGVDIVDERRVL